MLGPPHACVNSKTGGAKTLSHAPIRFLEARNAQPRFLGSWAVLIVTGGLLFASAPLKLYYSTPFTVKMVCLVLGTIFALTVRRNVTLAGEGRLHPIWLKLVALVSLALWFGVGAGGRWIGFTG